MGLRGDRYERQQRNREQRGVTSGIGIFEEGVPKPFPKGGIRRPRPAQSAENEREFIGHYLARKAARGGVRRADKEGPHLVFLGQKPPNFSTGCSQNPKLRGFPTWSRKPWHKHSIFTPELPCPDNKSLCVCPVLCSCGRSDCPVPDVCHGSGRKDEKCPGKCKSPPTCTADFQVSSKEKPKNHPRTQRPGRAARNASRNSAKSPRARPETRNRQRLVTGGRENKPKTNPKGAEPNATSAHKGLRALPRLLPPGDLPRLLLILPAPLRLFLPIFYFFSSFFLPFFFPRSIFPFFLSLFLPSLPSLSSFPFFFSPPLFLSPSSPLFFPLFPPPLFLSFPHLQSRFFPAEIAAGADFQSLSFLSLLHHPTLFPIPASTTSSPGRRWARNRKREKAAARQIHLFIEIIKNVYIYIYNNKGRKGIVPLPFAVLLCGTGGNFGRAEISPRLSGGRQTSSQPERRPSSLGLLGAARIFVRKKERNEAPAVPQNPLRPSETPKAAGETRGGNSGGKAGERILY
ncbi:uncharacterized protein LOC134430779 [Melospiza melodia melodia]|uniref:uncharacterized protein LOC134430779 n=1 Tax=Melospiza melodia melodia TaxID=1914991 RepID=UPI002FD2FC06